jgi:hypothetical protein
MELEAARAAIESGTVREDREPDRGEPDSGSMLPPLARRAIELAREDAPRRPVRLSQSAMSNRAIKRAQEEARNRTDRRVGTRHLLLGLLGLEYRGVTEVLTALGIDPSSVRSALLAAMGETPPTEGRAAE